MSDILLFLEEARPCIKMIRYYPRSEPSGNTGLQQRMVGGQFQGSNSGSDTGYITLATITQRPPEGIWSEIVLEVDRSYRWFRYLSPDGGYGNVAEIELRNAAGHKIIGIPFGLDPSYGTVEAWRYPAAWDGDLSTFYDYAYAASGYTGIEITGLALPDSE